VAAGSIPAVSLIFRTEFTEIEDWEHVKNIFFRLRRQLVIRKCAEMRCDSAIATTKEK
jgi:hypothetical protein